MAQNKIPPLPPGFVVDEDTTATTSKPTAPVKSETPGEALYAGVKHGAGQVAGSLWDTAKGLSPIRFREGWTSPTAEVPETIKNVVGGAAQTMWHGMSGNAMGMLQDAQAPLAPVGPIAAGIAAGVAPESFQAPSQQEWDQSTQQATQTALSLAAPYVISKIPGPRAIQGMATKSGRAQELGGTQSSGLPFYKSPTMSSDMTAGTKRWIGRKLYDVTQDPRAQVEKVGTYIQPPGSVQPPPPEYVDAEMVQRPSPPAVAPAQRQIGGQQLQIESKTSYQPQLPPSPVIMTAPGEGSPLPPSPYLPESYNQVPVYTPPEGPGLMLRGHPMVGEEGGIPPRGEQTITGVKPKPVREGGRFRKGTEADLAAEKGNVGRTTRQPKPAPKKTPVKSPEKPKPPTRKK